MNLHGFLQSIGEEVDDSEEGMFFFFFFLSLLLLLEKKELMNVESFLLFSQDIPSANLGFIDSRATTVDISILGEDYTVHQSPTLLSSSRARGTTGAGMYEY